MRTCRKGILPEWMRERNRERGIHPFEEDGISGETVNEYGKSPKKVLPGCCWRRWKIRKLPRWSKSEEERDVLFHQWKIAAN